MYRVSFLIIILIFTFSSCSNKQKQEKQKKETFINQPITITASQPIITLLDTCPKPFIIVIPTKDSNKYIYPSPIELQEIVIHPPKSIPILDGEAGGFSFMQNYTAEQGLTLNAVWCSYKDRIGNLWFGTMTGGVSKYDGKCFTNYTTAQGLANSNIRCIIEDKSGNLWFGTNGGGVSKYDGKSFTNFTIIQGLVNDVVLGITEDKKGNLWFSTIGGISKYDPTVKEESNILSSHSKQLAFTNFTTDQGLISNVVTCCITDKKGNLWFGTNKGISKYNPNRTTGSIEKAFTNYTTADGLTTNSIINILEDKNGNLWFGTEKGISIYNPNLTNGQKEKLFSNFNQTHGLLPRYISSLAEDKNGNIWISMGEGVTRYTPNLKEGANEKPFTKFTTKQGLASNQVFCITEDKTGNIWFGTNGAGICKYNGKSFTSFTHEQGLVYSKVWSLLEDKSDNLWFVTAAGLSKYDRKSFANIRLGIITSNVRCVIEDRMGNIWFGGVNGATKYDGNRVEAIEAALQRGEIIPQRTQQNLKKINGKLVKSYTNYTTAQGLSNNSILSISEDKKGNLWFGTYGGGVCKYDGNRVEAIENGENIPLENQKDLKKINEKFVKSFTNYSTKQGLAGNIIKCILMDKSGDLWFGTNGNGVSKYTCPVNGGTSIFTNYSKTEGLSNNTILSMMEDKSGAIWIGTSGGGVCRLNPLKKNSLTSSLFTNYSTADGLADDVVYAIVEDIAENTIWFGTNLGLSGLKINSLSEGTDAVKFENFNNKTGYPIKDVNTSALILDKKGILWAGTSDRLVRFDYKSIHKNTDPPTVFIQSVKIQGESITWYKLKSKEFNGTEMHKTDSMAILNEEIIANGISLSEIRRNELCKKFSDLKFDSITPFYPVPINLVLPFKHNNITLDFGAIETSRPQLIRYQYILEGYDNDWNPITDKSSATFGNIYEGTYTFKLKARSPEGIWSLPIKYTFKVLPPWYRTWWMYSFYFLIALSIIWLFFRWRTGSLRREKEKLENTVKERTAEVVEQKDLLVEQKDLIEEKQKEIVDSINYAKRIQYTLLAHDRLLQQNLKEYFVLFQPKDIVSGDFYWATSIVRSEEIRVESEKKSTCFYLAICDSTGHGVPGAFMSLLNISFLNEAITEKHIKQPHEILNHVRQRLIESVSQDGAQDGMDGILLCIEFPSPEFIPTKEGERDGRVSLTYAAANNAPVIVRNNSIINLPADKMPIGKGEKNNSFTLHTIDTRKGDTLYFYTDGYADQFGGAKGKKLKKRTLENLLISIHKKTMEEQKQILAATIGNWKGNLEQVDDILVIGMRIGYE